MKLRLHYLMRITFTFLVLPVISVLTLQAQEYLISFAGSGASTTVATVKVENITRGTSLEMNGSDILHLNVITGIEPTIYYSKNGVSFYPNPIKDYTRMQFVLPEAGETVITLYDISGREIAQTRGLLLKGQHIYRIQGVEKGMYFVMINSGRYSLSGRLICSFSQNSSTKIVYENAVEVKDKQIDSKGTYEEKVMQYTTGDRLKLTGASGIYKTVMTDVPASTKTITFNFAACTDGDGNNYPIVAIGTGKSDLEYWMAENLKTTRYDDWTEIPLVTVNSVWMNLTTPAFCWYFNDEAAYKVTYGALYNWYAVKKGKLCPSGWHVPSDEEWKVLEISLGMTPAEADRNAWRGTTEGGKLKETSTVHWVSPNQGATDEVGFKALPGGVRYGVFQNGAFATIGYQGFWWSSTVYSTTPPYVWHRMLASNLSTMHRNCGEYTYGYSVRCVMD